MFCFSISLVVLKSKKDLTFGLNENNNLELGPITNTDNLVPKSRISLNKQETMNIRVDRPRSLEVIV